MMQSLNLQSFLINEACFKAINSAWPKGSLLASLLLLPLPIHLPALSKITAVIGNSSISKVYMAEDGAAEIYAYGTINTSDLRLKKDINNVFSKFSLNTI